MVNVPNVKAVQCHKQGSEARCTIYGRTTHNITVERNKIRMNADVDINTRSNGFGAEFDSETICQYHEKFPGVSSEMVCKNI